MHRDTCAHFLPNFAPLSTSRVSVQPIYLPTLVLLSEVAVARMVLSSGVANLNASTD